MTMQKRGYHDSHHTSLERILGEEEYVVKLTSGGEPKEALVRDIVSSLEEVDDKPAEEDMIVAIMETLGKEGVANDDVRREATLCLVTDPTFAEILSKHDSTLYNRYIAGIEAVSPSQETVLGPVDALLEAGKAFAPVFVRRADEQRIVGIANAWNACAARLKEPSVQRHVLHESAQLVSQMVSEAQKYKASKGRETTGAKKHRANRAVEQAHKELDREEIEEYIIDARARGMKREDILAELAPRGVTRHTYNSIVTSLLDRGATRNSTWRKPKK